MIKTREVLAYASLDPPHIAEPPAFGRRLHRKTRLYIEVDRIAAAAEIHLLQMMANRNFVQERRL